MILDFYTRTIEPGHPTPEQRIAGLEGIIDQLEEWLMAFERREEAREKRWRRAWEWLPIGLLLAASVLMEWLA